MTTQEEKDILEEVHNNFLFRGMFFSRIKGKVWNEVIGKGFVEVIPNVEVGEPLKFGLFVYKITQSGLEEIGLG